MRILNRRKADARLSDQVRYLAVLVDTDRQWWRIGNGVGGANQSYRWFLEKRIRLSSDYKEDSEDRRDNGKATQRNHAPRDPIRD
jgi:hypothetical protein